MNDRVTINLVQLSDNIDITAPELLAPSISQPTEPKLNSHSHNSYFHLEAPAWWDVKPHNASVG